MNEKPLMIRLVFCDYGENPSYIGKGPNLPLAMLDLLEALRETRAFTEKAELEFYEICSRAAISQNRRAYGYGFFIQVASPSKKTKRKI